METKPFYYSTKFFDVTFHGKRTPGGQRRRRGSEDQQKQQVDQVITNQSRRKFCVLLDSVPEFVCRYRIKLFFDSTPDPKKSKTCLHLFTRYLGKEDFNEKSEKPPLFFWKKFNRENKYGYELLTNAQLSFSPGSLDRVIKYLWYKYSRSPEATIEKIKKSEEINVIREYGLNFQGNLPENSASRGKWWGIINRKYYKFISPEKRYVTLKEIIELESSESQRITDNLFLK